MTITIVLFVSFSAGSLGVVAVLPGRVAFVPEGTVIAGALSLGSVEESVGGAAGTVVGSVAEGVVAVSPVALFSTLPQTVQV